MTGPILIFIGAIVLIYALVELNRKPPEMKLASFRIPLKRGSLTATVSFLDLPNAQPRILRVINRWAVRLGDPKHPLDNQLERKLRQLPFKASVVGVSLDGTEPPPEPPKKLTMSEKLVKKVKSKVESAEALATTDFKVPDLSVRGRPLKNKVEDYVELVIGDLFDHDDHI